MKMMMDFFFTRWVLPILSISSLLLLALAPLASASSSRLDLKRIGKISTPSIYWMGS